MLLHHETEIASALEVVAAAMISAPGSTIEESRAAYRAQLVGEVQALGSRRDAISAVARRTRATENSL
jgi:chemotaxis response regulator CheB